MISHIIHCAKRNAPYTLCSTVDIMPLIRKICSLQAMGSSTYGAKAPLGMIIKWSSATAYRLRNQECNLVTLIPELSLHREHNIFFNLNWMSLTSNLHAWNKHALFKKQQVQPLDSHFLTCCCLQHGHLDSDDNLTRYLLLYSSVRHFASLKNVGCVILLILCKDQWYLAVSFPPICVANSLSMPPWHEPACPTNAWTKSPALQYSDQLHTQAVQACRYTFLHNQPVHSRELGWLCPHCMPALPALSMVDHSY